MPAKVKIPAGEKITISHGKLQVPDHPIIAFIEGDGTGPDIWQASVRVLDAAVAQAYKGRRKIAWAETYAGEKAQAVYGADCPPNLLPQETLDVIREHLVAIKGPLTTPVGEGDDFARLMEGAKEVKCSVFGTAIVDTMAKL